jgi:hypothetical protein
MILLLFMTGLVTGYQNIKSTQLPLYVSGRLIVDQQGLAHRLQCVEWSGSHMQQFVVSGLDKNSLENIIKLINVKFNCVRLSFSLDLIYTNATIDPKYVTKESRFGGKSAIQVYKDGWKL